VLQAISLSKSYSQDVSILREVTVTLPEDETLAIVGPSGCGKTTLLYMLCGLLQPDAGDIMLLGKKVRAGAQEIAIILQDYGLLPWRTALENVALGLKIRGLGAARRRGLSRQLLEELGLGGREHHYPSQLSGGEQQRVAIARALALEPKLLLMDEPFSSLDAMTREKLQTLLLDTWNRRRIPYLLITHSIEEAVFLGRRILVLGGRPASVVKTFDNPGFGHADYREQRAFFDMVQAVRGTMAVYW
jgi:ABC-type nitrate/sulfonate/bicarbonate transport system ATPase subunit